MTFKLNHLSLALAAALLAAPPLLMATETGIQTVSGQQEERWTINLKDA